MALTGYEKYKVEDNAQGQLNASITSGATSITLKSGEGANFPSTGNYICTLIQFDGSGFEESNVVKREKIKVTARSSDVLTVERGFDGSSATSFDADDYIFLTVTASLLEDIQNAISNLDTNKLETDGLRTGLSNNWRIYYTNGSGQETELALGDSGKVLQSNGASSAPTWESVSVNIDALSTDNATPVAGDYLMWSNGGTEGKREALSTTTHFGLARMQTDAEAAAGTNEEGYMNAKQVADNYTVVSKVTAFTATFVDTGNGNTMNIAHGCGKIPRSMSFVSAGSNSPGTTAGQASYDGTTITQKTWNVDDDIWENYALYYSPNSDTDEGGWAITSIDATNITLTYTHVNGAYTTFDQYFIVNCVA